MAQNGPPNHEHYLKTIPGRAARDEGAEAAREALAPRALRLRARRARPDRRTAPARSLASSVPGRG